MSRITRSSGGNGTVNIQATNGDVITATNGALNVNTDGTVGFDTLTPGTPTQVAVGTTSTQIFAPNPDRKYLHIVNNSAESIYIQYQATAALNQGIKLTPGSLYTVELSNLWLGSINAIGLINSQLIDILEGT